MEGLPLFATTFNERMIKALTKAGFVQRGREWRRKQGGQMLSLWIKGNTPK
jgi:hypothetical protein